MQIISCEIGFDTEFLNLISGKNKKYFKKLYAEMFSKECYALNLILEHRQLALFVDYFL